jgi:uncharacterized protein (TIGR02145 family)
MKLGSLSGSCISLIFVFLSVYTSRCEMEKPATLPELTTVPITNITSTSAVCGGSIVSDGGSDIITRGVCWSENFEPTISDNVSSDGEGTGSFSSPVEGLTSGTIYYIRAYATNNIGTAYGNKFLFITPLTDIEGNVYPTVMIGDQVWMAENLRTTKYFDNTKIPYVTDNTAWSALSTPGCCWYKNDESRKYQKYGLLYNWFTVNTGKLCPAGWHIPSEDEWIALTDYLGGESYAGGKLKELGIGHWTSPNAGASDIFGFSALPGGYRSGLYSGTFRALGYIGWWWAGKESDPEWARSRTLAFDESVIAKGKGLKINGYSVRCVKDQHTP